MALSGKEQASLIKAALAARENAYAPYSHFAVGAAILSADGRVFAGCNVENVAYPAGICAERAALCSAISAGVRDFSAIALVGGKEGCGKKICPIVLPAGSAGKCFRNFSSRIFLLSCEKERNLL